MGYADIKEISIALAKRQILGWLATLNLPTTFWGEGSFPMMVVEVGARIWNKSSIVAAQLKTLTVGEDAKGDILDVWSQSVYGHTRNPSQAAIHIVTLTCAAGAGPYTITNGQLIATDGTYQFTNLTCTELPISYPVTLAAGSSVTLPFQADKPGSASSSIELGAINRLITTLAGVTVTNAETSIGAGSSLLRAGAAKESDYQLRERNRTIWATRNIMALPIDGYIYWARTVNGVRRVGVIANNPRGEYTVDVVLAGDTGAVGTEEETAVSGVLEAKLLPNFFTGVSVYSATPVAFTPAGKIGLKPGTDPAQAQVAILHALKGNTDDADDPVNDVALERILPVGGETFDGTAHQVLRARFENAIKGALIGDQLCVDTVELTSPESYTTISADEVPTITVTFDDTHLDLIVLTS